MKSQVKTMTQLTRRSHIASVRKTDQDLIAQICEQIGWTEDRYNWHQFDNYLNFIDIMFRGFPAEMRQQVKYSPVFRGFWNNEASLRNTEFIPYAFDTHDIKEKRAEFLFMHDPLTLMNDDFFMLKYNNTLTIIRKEPICYR